ncbi:MAG: JAB domain-containing protein [Candidatus Falkowbacteria bacterium]|nr:JAB domain-containing protein [Candidatus Falkowbacteria bacterium]
MNDKKVIAQPEDAVKIAESMLLDENKEHFIGLYLNVRNQLKKRELISMGTLNANLVHPRETFRPAIINRAASVIVLHNHPSGDSSPSSADIELTSRLKKVGELLGIDLIDHIIFSPRGDFYSFKDRKGI